MKKVKEEEKDKSYVKIIITIIFVSILVLFVISISFVTFINGSDDKKEGNIEDNKNNIIRNGTISMTYTEDVNGIKIDNAIPISDDSGKILSGENGYFDFTVTSKIVGKTNVTYEIVAIKDNDSTLDDKDVKLYLEKQTSGSYEEILSPTEFKPLTQVSDIGAPIGSMVLTRVTTKTSSTDNYRLRMWLSDKANIDGVSRSYSIKVNIYGKAK